MVQRVLERLHINRQAKKLTIETKLIGSANRAKHVWLLGWFSRHAMHCELAFFMTSLAFQRFDRSMEQWSLNFEDFLVQNAETFC